MVETRPSSSHRWTRCSAAPLFSSRAKVRPAEGDPAKEGTCAAWAAEVVLKGQAHNAHELIGESHENGWIIDEEMAGHIQGYVDMIRAEGGAINVEKFVRLSPRVAGTLDNSAWFANGVLRIRDLKYGRNIVEADAPQLIIYGNAEGDAIGWEHIKEVYTEIYQPRGSHPDGIHRRHKWSVDEFRAAGEWIKQRAELCHQPNPVATPGIHCTYCEGAVGCAALAATSMNLLALVESDQRRDLTPQEMANWLDALTDASKIISAAKNAAEAEAETRIMTGERIPSYTVSQSEGNRQFAHPRETIHAMTGVDPVKEVPLSPNQLQGKGVPKRIIDQLVERPPTKAKLRKLDPNELKRQFERN